MAPSKNGSSSSSTKMLKIGSRKSELAMIQTNYVVDALKKIFPDLEVEIITKTTTGDQILDVALPKIGDKSLFTKELEVALESEEVDIVVHSLKDLPTQLPPKMIIGAILEREDPSDAAILRKDSKFSKLSELPDGSIVGTSSVRRAAQLRRNFPGLVLKDVRGNLNTRFRKLDAESHDYDALLLAAAGVTRMKWQDRISQTMNATECLHAVGQGAIGIECREGDEASLAIIGKLTDRSTALACVAERAFLRDLEGGCSAPVAAHAALDDNESLCMEGAVWSIDGKIEMRETLKVSTDKNDSTAAKKAKLEENERQYSSFVSKTISLEDLEAAEKLGVDLAKKLLDCGAKRVLLEAKAATSAAN